MQILTIHAIETGTKIAVLPIRSRQISLISLLAKKQGICRINIQNIKG